MTGCQPSWVELNAYVDGELDAGRAESVARAVACDAEVAAQVAALRRLKTVAGRAVEQTPPAAPAPPRRQAVRRLAVLRLGVAACLAVLLLSAGLLLAERMIGPGRASLVARGWAGHEAWLAGGAGGGVEPSFLLTALAGLGPQARVPQLDAAKLRLDHVAMLPGSGDGGALLHLGYRGLRGCRLSLFIFAAEGDWPGDYASAAGEGRLGVGWQVADLGYLLLARGMDPGRFDLIAATVAEATRLRQPFDAAARSALRRSREAGPPCRA